MTRANLHYQRQNYKCQQRDTAMKPMLPATMEATSKFSFQYGQVQAQTSACPQILCSVQEGLRNSDI